MTNSPHFKKILIANRSEIAVRVIHACRTLGIPTVAVYSEADRQAVHSLLADEAVHIGPSSPRESYLNAEKIIDAARATGADAIHPGYGFLAENHRFASQCREAGVTFIGPTPDAIRLMGNKVESRIKMAEAAVPLVPGMKASGTDFGQFAQAAAVAGYPVMIKAAAGGGGKGMRVVERESDLADALETARREAMNAFGDDSVYLEKYIVNPRHIEFQVMADSHGNTVHLFERECSIQRRHQKIIEETPSVALTDELRQRMGSDAVKAAQAVGYTNAGTIEFLLDPSGAYYFLEMNTRIQVEHPVTEMVTGTDLVVEQIRVAAGLPLSEQVLAATQRGHAIECRMYAEDGETEFMPSTGRILYYREPKGPGIRVDSGVRTDSEITIDYDPIMAKLIVHAPDRPSAITKMIAALKEFKLLGVRTSRRFMIDVLEHEAFTRGETFTDFIPRNMTTRTAALDHIHELAAAAAAADEAGRTMSVSGGGTGHRVASTPWQTLGPIRVGGSIRD